MMRLDEPGTEVATDTRVDTLIYSIVRIRELSYEGDDLQPIPEYLIQGEDPPIHVDPEGIVGGTTDGILVGIHATDPPVGPGDTSVRSLIGLTVRPAGTHRDVPVPIIPNITELADGQTMPPNPTSPGTTLVAKLWRFASVNGIPVPRPVTVDNSPVTATATMTGGLDLNAAVPTFEFSKTGLSPTD